MFVGCSEISISVTVKHMQHIGIVGFLSAWGDLLSFSVSGGADTELYQNDTERERERER